MRLGSHSPRVFAALAFAAVVCGACQKDNALSPMTAPQSGAAALRTAALAPSTSNSGGTTNGAAGQMPAFYDGTLFTINMMELPASGTLIAKNPNFNQIYATNDLDDEQDFNPVIDAIQGDGFNPLWRQNLIRFNAGFTPHQFTSDEEVLNAAKGSNPEITIVPTGEIYRCSVVGSK